MLQKRCWRARVVVRTPIRHAGSARHLGAREPVLRGLSEAHVDYFGWSGRDGAAGCVGRFQANSASNICDGGSRFCGSGASRGCGGHVTRINKRAARPGTPRENFQFTSATHLRPRSTEISQRPRKNAAYAQASLCILFLFFQIKFKKINYYRARGLNARCRSATHDPHAPTRVRACARVRCRRRGVTARLEECDTSGIALGRRRASLSSRASSRAQGHDRPRRSARARRGCDEGTWADVSGRSDDAEETQIRDTLQ